MSPRRLPTMVRTLREPRGMTQFDLARKANVVAQGYLGDLGKAELARPLE
jgi:transcriptional regulator with XRE-family HTH domain